MEQEVDSSRNRDISVIRCPIVSLVKGLVINAQGVNFNLNKYYKGMQKSTQVSIFHLHMGLVYYLESLE